MTLEEEIIILSNKLYKYVSLDHHKDRDCHWYIEKIYSYGQEPYFIASHNGYLGEQWTSPKLGSMELAETMIVNRLKAEIHNGLNHLKDTLPMGAEIHDYLGVTKERIKEVIKELEA